MLRIRSRRFLTVVPLCAAISSLFAIGGCKETTKPGPPAETRAGRAEWGRGTDPNKLLKPGIDFAVVQYVIWNGRLAFALWTDLGGAPNSFPNEISSFLQPNSADAEGRYSGSIQEKQAPVGPVIEFTCVTKDGTNGAITVDGKNFALSDGYLLLVSTAEGKVRLRQLKRDPLIMPKESRPQDVVAALEKLKADPGIVGFFAR